MRTPGINPEAPGGPSPIGYPMDNVDVKKFFEPEKPAPLTTGGDIRMPYQAPPLSGTRAAEMPAMPSAPLARPTPPPFEPPGLNAPRNITTFSPSKPIDYRGRPILDEEDFERNQYMRKGAKLDEQGNITGFKRNWKDTLLGAGLGAARGLATGGGLGAALGGAVGGAAVPLINPKRGREGLFEATQAPMIRANVQRGREQENQTRQQAMQDLERRKVEAQTGMIEAQAADFPAEMESRRSERAAQEEERRARAEKLRQAPIPRARNIFTDEEGYVRDRDTGEKMIDPATGEPIGGKTKPITPEEAEVMRAQDEGTQEQIAQSYMEGRRESLKGRLSPRERDIINGAARDASDEEVSKAMARWQAIQDKEMESIRLEVAQNARVNASKYRTGAKPKTRATQTAPMTKSQPSGASRPIKDFNSSKFPGLKFN